MHLKKNEPSLNNTLLNHQRSQFSADSGQDASSDVIATHIRNLFDSPVSNRSTANRSHAFSPIQVVFLNKITATTTSASRITNFEEKKKKRSKIRHFWPQRSRKKKLINKNKEKNLRELLYRLTNTVCYS